MRTRPNCLTPLYKCLLSQLLVLKLVETVDTKIVSVNLDKKSWCDVMERMEKKGIKIMSGRGECFDIGGYSVRKTLARLHDKEGLYTCTPGQAFEKTTEFSTMQGIVFTPATKNFIGKTFKDEDYKGSMVVGVEKLIWV